MTVPASYKGEERAMIVTTEPQVTDSLETADDLSPGDIVFFQQVGPSAIVARLASPELLPELTGPLFVLEVTETKSVRFRQVSRDELTSE